MRQVQRQVSRAGRWVFMDRGASPPSLSAQQSFRACFQSTFSHETEETLEQQLQFPRLPGSDIGLSLRCARRPTKHPVCFAEQRNRWTVTVALRRFKGSKGAKGRRSKGSGGGVAEGGVGEGVGGVRIVTMATVTSLKGLCAYPEWEFCLWGGKGKQRSDRRRHFVPEFSFALFYVLWVKTTLSFPPKALNLCLRGRSGAAADSFGSYINTLITQSLLCGCEWHVVASLIAQTEE